MAIERSWPAIGPVSLTAQGTTNGILTVTSTLGFKVKMQVILTDSVLGRLILGVKRVMSPTQLAVGPVEGKLSDRSDVSAWGVTASLSSVEQSRPSIPLQEIERSVYEEEPTVARRWVWVDPYGRHFTPQNPVPTQTNLVSGYTSAVNSSSTPLGSNGAFTGAFEDVTGYSYLTLMVFANQASATNGLEFQWSSDGINADRVEVTNVKASQGRAFALGIRGKYFRVKYTNGTAAQSSFRLQVVYHLHGQGIITKPLNGAVNTDNFAQLVQAPVMAKLADNTFINIAGLNLGLTGLIGIAEADPIIAELGGLFTASTAALSAGATSETPMVLISNPAGSGKIFRLNKVVFGIPSTDFVLWTCYLNPTVTTNGTPLTPIGNRQTGQSAPVVQIFTSPTTTSFGSRFFSVRTADTGVPFLYDQEFSRLIEPGNRMLITVTQSFLNSNAHLTLEYAETPI